MVPPKKERGRSGLAVKISVVIHSGEEADVECASVRERHEEGVCQRERERGREALPVCAALLPG